jgi:hypothetical protein
MRGKVSGKPEEDGQIAISQLYNRSDIERETSMKKMLMGVVAGAVVLMAGCGGGKYAEVKKVMKETNAATAEATAALEKATTGKEVAAALDTYTNAMEKQLPKMKELSAKYPELKDPNPPEELKPLQQESVTIGTKFGQTMTTQMMKYMNDPDVKKAMDRMGKVMQEGMK